MKKNVSFEEAMKRLEEIVSRMEQGNASLEESLAMFEEGTALVKLCSNKLDDAELKVVQLVKGNDGEPEEMEFTHEE